MKKVGNTPLSARIKVDFEKKDVSFSYPGGRDSFLRRFKIIVGFLWLIFLPVILFVPFAAALVNSAHQFASTPEDMVVALVFLLKASFVFSAGAITMLLIAAIMAYDYDRYASTFPKIQFFVRSITAPVKEIRINNIENNEFVLPTFANVVLDYTLNGDFAEKISCIDITDYPYDIYINGDTYPDIRMWKAIFKFKENPTSGNMILKFL